MVFLQYSTVCNSLVPSSHKSVPLLPPSGTRLFSDPDRALLFFPTLDCLSTLVRVTFDHVVGQRFIAQHTRCGTFQAGQITLAERMLGVQGETDQM